ncbi:hypothetical protein [Megamonas hypermegale]|uniref:hypothetical protein n=1 Tax=Megamonas hypermegale TaxID=158847 RepID=UPI0024323F29|nr:hypothetical protein [Megamonas hypermegale]
MFEECLEVFKKELQKKGEDIILDEYIPADGSYLIVKKDGSVKCVEVKMDKKTRTLEKLDKSDEDFSNIRIYDYHSKLISMNKPVDPKKVIHSNNYFSFAVKKDSVVSGKLTEDIIDGYYRILADPLENKYKKSKEASRIYKDFEQKNGTVDLELLEKNKTWIKEHIFKIDETAEIDMTKKDYLKIFFEADEADYVREDNRYVLPHIYNSNDYNVEIDGKIFGIPNDNYGMNAKKPFLSIKTRKNPAGYLLNGEKVLLQKQFFDYLMNLASAGKYNVYIDTESDKINAYVDKEERKNSDSIAAGYYLRLKKGKELEIQVQDNIVDYRNKLATYFEFKDIAGIKFKNIADYSDNYKEYTTRIGLGKLINNVFFSKFLINNYFVDASDISINDSILKRSIITYRDLIFGWVYKGIDNNFAEAVEKFSIDLIKNSVLNDNKIRGVLQLNLRWSLREYFKQNKGGDKMADIVADLRKSMKEKILNKNEVIMPVNDREYYYGIGQLMAYFISLSRANKKTQSMINPVINAKTDRIIKDRLLQLYKKYNYDMLTNNYRVKNLYAMILGYKPEGKIDQEMILFGYMDNNLIYTKEEK